MKSKTPLPTIIPIPKPINLEFAEKHDTKLFIVSGIDKHKAHKKLRDVLENLTVFDRLTNVPILINSFCNTKKNAQKKYYL